MEKFFSPYTVDSNSTLPQVLKVLRSFILNTYIDNIFIGNHDLVTEDSPHTSMRADSHRDYILSLH